MKNEMLLEGPSIETNDNPKKLIFMLHGYGDNAENFIQVAESLRKDEWKANYYALNAPLSIPGSSSQGVYDGFQWFNIYPNGIYIADAGPAEIILIHEEIKNAVKKIEKKINLTKNKYNLKYSDCFLMGFSQGGIMTFEFGDYFKKTLGGLAILSGRILPKNIIKNKYLLKTPLFLSHGDQDEILDKKYYYNSCELLEKNKFIFEKHLITGDQHTISLKAIELLQEFIKKNI